MYSSQVVRRWHYLRLLSAGLAVAMCVLICMFWLLATWCAVVHSVIVCVIVCSMFALLKICICILHDNYGYGMFMLWLFFRCVRGRSFYVDAGKCR